MAVIFPNPKDWRHKVGIVANISKLTAKKAKAEELSQV